MTWVLVRLLSVVLAAVQTAPATVTIATADGGSLVADQYGAGTDAVVLAHGARFDKESWSAQARALAAQGHLVLALDFRGYGRSTPGRDPRALFEDVLATVRHARSRGARTVSVVGASMGGGASARAAVEARPGEIDRLVLLSPVSIDAPERIHAGRILYIASRDEPMAGGIREQFARAPEPKRIAWLDGDGHAQNIFATPQGPALTRLLLDALR